MRWPTTNSITNKRESAMRQPTYIWPVPPVQSLPISGQEVRYPINRLFFVGRNYHAHAVEMARPVDKSVDKPFYFTKTPQTLVHSGATVPYPAQTSNYQFELELVVAIGKTGFRVPANEAHAIIYGYAVGLDMTRRDLQLAARDKGRPWDVGKDIENGSVVSAIAAMPGQVLSSAELVLTVNGQVKQHANVDQLIWDIREQIADLSTFYHLQPGDLIFTGTPEGVGPVLPGDVLHGRIQGVGEVNLRIGQAE
jgi:fumarylpyruvate hydrolase